MSSRIYLNKFKYHFYLYKITNLINSKSYIGQRASLTSPEEDEYMGSGDLIKAAIKKYGKSNFKKEIIWKTDSEENLNKLEPIMIKLYKSLYPRGYNIALGGNAPMRGRKQTEKYKKIMSERMSREKHPFWGKKKTEESNLKMADKRRWRKTKRGSYPYGISCNGECSKPWRVRLKLGYKQKSTSFGNYKTIEEAKDCLENIFLSLKMYS
jgi:group I intron endonuclease